MGMAEAIKERPILFRGPMVRAILEGRKAQTRRRVKLPKGYCIQRCNDGELYSIAEGEVGEPEPFGDSTPLCKKCPYGQPGERLWVRENCYLDKEIIYEIGARRCFYADSAEMCFESGERGISPAGPLSDDCMKLNASLRFRASRFMPRWASRINLEIVRVRVERLQEITEGDAIEEGFMFAGFGDDWKRADSFLASWDSHNAAPFDWASNPWVWVIEFNKL